MDLLKLYYIGIASTVLCFDLQIKSRARAFDLQIKSRTMFMLRL